MKMTREMYESLQAKDLKAIAESRGLAVGTRPRKETLIVKLLQLDEEEETKKNAALEAQKAAEEEAQQAARAASAPEPAAGAPADVPGRASADVPGRPEGTAGAEGRGAAPADAADAGAAGEPSAERTRSDRDRRTAPSRGDGSSARKVRRVVKTRGASGRSAAAQEPDAAAEEPHAAQAARKEQREQKDSVPEAAAEPAGPAQEARAVSSSGPSRSGAPAGPAQYGIPAGRDAQPAGSLREETAYAPEAAQAAEERPAGAVRGSGGERTYRRGYSRQEQQPAHKNELNPELDSGEIAHGILEVMGDGFGFIRSDNYMPGDNDVYVAPSQIRRFSLKTGDIVEGNIRIRSQNEKFSALLFVKSVNGMDPELTKRRSNFEDMTPIFPNERIRLERPGGSIAMRVMDLMCPVGKGQRGMIVSQPKAGKTTLLKDVARSVKMNNPNIHLIILLIDERPEEVTDLREALEGPNVEVIYSTFDELPEHHKRVAEMTIERAKRLVENRQDVMILLDSITRLTRAYNLTEPSSGRTLSGGLDPVALHMPKRFFGAARNMREGGSLTILATALIETGSKMDDVVYEEFKGTGNMEMILNRRLSERRIFPAVDLAKSGTRRDDLLLTPDEQDCVAVIRRAFIGARGEEATDSVLDLFSKTRSNGEFVSMVRKHLWSF